MDAFRQNFHHDVVVNIVEEAFDVSLYKPLHPGKTGLDLAQGRVAASAGAEPMGLVGKPALIDGLEQQPDTLLHQLVIEGGNAQGTQFSVLDRKSVV